MDPLYDFVDKTGNGSKHTKYEKWAEPSKPNLMTYLDAFNLSQPIIGAQFELRMSRWPRTIFFAKSITVPGISAATLELNHYGFTIAIPTHIKYESTEISFTIIADKEGFHYYDLRNMVLQTGHPLVAGDPRSTIGDEGDEDILDIRLRNSEEDGTHHHWIVHNFKPTSIGELELGHENTGFVEFDLTGTFTHIHYDCGKVNPVSETPPPSYGDSIPEPENKEGDDSPEDEEYPDLPYYPEEPQPEPEPEPPKTWDDLDDDAKDAVDVIDDNPELDPEKPEDREKLKDKLKDQLKDKYPHEDPATLDDIADKALDNAKDFRDDNPIEKDTKTTTVPIEVKEPPINVQVDSTVELADNPSPEERALAKKANDALADAAQELAKDLGDIANIEPGLLDKLMGTEIPVNSADANVEPTPKDGQNPDDEGNPGDSIGVGVTADAKFKSPEQKEAFDKAMQKYKDATQKIMDDYKKDKDKINNPPPEDGEGGDDGEGDNEEGDEDDKPVSEMSPQEKMDKLNELQQKAQDGTMTPEDKKKAAELGVDFPDDPDEWKDAKKDVQRGVKNIFEKMW